MQQYLGAATLAHFEGLQRLLRASGVAFQLNFRLVRGLDYYNLTVFEWVSDRLGAQGTVCGGGRYDGLFAQLGGKPAPGVGFAAGVLSPPTRSSEQMHIVERFTFDPQKFTLRRDYSVTDPVNLAEPYESYDVMYLSDVPLEKHACKDMTPEFQQ